MGTIAELKGKTRQDVQLNIRMAAETKERIERAAKVARQSLTEFTETAAIERADAVLTSHERIVLSERDYALFQEIMTAETEPTEKALQEAAEFRQGRKHGSRYQW